MAISKINSKSIADGTVVGADITPGTVTNAKISPSAAIANAKLANSSISINGTSVSLGGSATVNAAIDWQAVTVADGSTTVNTTAGKGYFLDTNAGVIEAFLPTSPTRGDRVVLADYSGTFATNQCIVNTGGALLDSTAGNDFKLTANNTIAEFIYVDAAKGWLVYLNQAAGTTPSSALEGFGGYDTPEPFIAATGGTVTTSGDYKIHTFTGDGCFVVSSTGLGTPTNPSTVDYLVVAGGGGSPIQNYTGGGGAGGYRESTGNSGCYTASPLATPTGVTVTSTTYPVTVGAGGGVGSAPVPASNGSPSVFSTITSAGGGHGGSDCNGAPQVGGSGGSGGGGGYTVHALSPGGAGNTPPTSPPQGNNGGLGHAQPSGFGANGGGGGGAGAAGQNATLPGQAGQGGDGVGTAINPAVGTPGPNGALRYFAGGGGGAQHSGSPASPRPGGVGGGGAGNVSEFEPPVCGTAGTANTGGGAGSKNATGGKGIVIIRYKFQ